MTLSRPEACERVRNQTVNDVMTHKGYSAAVGFDADDGLFVGRIAGIRDGVAFHGDSVGALRAAFEEAVDDYLDTCAKLGRAPQKPYSDKGKAAGL